MGRKYISRGKKFLGLQSQNFTLKKCREQAVSIQSQGNSKTHTDSF